MHSHQNKNRGNRVDGKQCIEQFQVEKAEQVEYTDISNKDGKIHQYINNNENKGSGVLQINRDLLKTRENSHIEVTIELF